MDEQILRTTIEPALLRKVLLRGTLFGAIGTAAILIGSFFPAIHLIRWGTLAVLLFILLVAYGLVPYRRLSRLQLHPDKLRLTTSEFFYIRRGAPLFGIKPGAVLTAKWMKRGEIYGIALKLSATVETLSEQVDLDHYLTLSRRRFDCDLFLPYFSKESLETLKRYLDESRLDQVVHLDQADKSPSL